MYTEESLAVPYLSLLPHNELSMQPFNLVESICWFRCQGYNMFGICFSHNLCQTSIPWLGA